LEDAALYEYLNELLQQFALGFQVTHPMIGAGFM
jgi:hypothetical protein